MTMTWGRSGQLSSPLTNFWKYLANISPCTINSEKGHLSVFSVCKLDISILTLSALWSDRAHHKKLSVEKSSTLGLGLQSPHSKISFGISLFLSRARLVLRPIDHWSHMTWSCFYYDTEDNILLQIDAVDSPRFYLIACKDCLPLPQKIPVVF